jgi:hypothetical protein
MNYHLKSFCSALASSAALTMSLMPLPALAQDAEPMVFCEYQPSLEELVGDYMVTTGPGVLSSGGVKIPMPDVQTHRATLALIDGVLVLYAEDTPPIDLMPVSGSEPDWEWSESDDLQMPSSEDMRLMEGCDINTFLRLTGRGIATSQEGRTFDYNINLIASKGVLYGLQSSWSVDGMTMDLRLTLSEIDG